MSQLDGKVAIVTGSSRSIGAEIARRLSQDGAMVVINYRSDKEGASEVADEVMDTGGEAITVQADVSETDDITNLFDTTVDRFGQVDIVVANAGIQPPASPISEVTEEEFDRVFGVNTRGIFLVLQEAANHLEDGGRIINIAPSRTVFPRAGLAVYGGSKTTPKFFAKVLAQELGDHDITVNSVVSGAVDAGFLEDADDDFKQELAAKSPLGRLGFPGDIADVVAFLASDDGRWITGQEILVNGGADV